MHYICLFYFIYLHRKYFHTYTCFQYFFQLNILFFTVSFPPNPCRVRISFHVYCTQFLYIWSCQTHKYNNYSRVTNILLSQILRFNHVLSHTHTISMPCKYYLRTIFFILCPIFWHFIIFPWSSPIDSFPSMFLGLSRASISCHVPDK